MDGLIGTHAMRLHRPGLVLALAACAAGFPFDLRPTVLPNWRGECFPEGSPYTFKACCNSMDDAFVLARLFAGEAVDSLGPGECWDGAHTWDRCCSLDSAGYHGWAPVYDKFFWTMLALGRRIFVLQGEAVAVFNSRLHLGSAGRAAPGGFSPGGQLRDERREGAAGRTCEVPLHYVQYRRSTSAVPDRRGVDWSMGRG